MSLEYGVIGVWLLVVGIVAIVVEGALAAIWTVRISRRAQALRERLLVEQGLLEADIARLRLALAATEVLWRPYGRLLRWLRHPLAIALVQSLVRRRSAAR